MNGDEYQVGLKQTDEEMRLAIHARQVGDEVEIVYFRGNAQKTTQATLVETRSNL